MKFAGLQTNTLGVEYAVHTDGNISFIWNDENSEAKTLADGSVLMELVFVRNSPLSTINSPLSIDESITAIEAVDADFNVHGIALNRVESIQLLQAETWVVSPNPTTGGFIKVQMNLKENKSLIFRLIDNTGRILLTKQVEGVKGTNNITLKKGTLASGTYYLKAEGIDGVKQLIIEN